MYFIFYFSIGFGTAFGANYMFAIDIICEIRHIHLRQTFVLKPREVRAGKRQTI